MAATDVITTVMLTGDPQWTAIDMSGKEVEMILIQDTDANIGVMGTRDQLVTMITRIAEAIISPPVSEMFRENSNGQ